MSPAEAGAITEEPDWVQVFKDRGDVWRSWPDRQVAIVFKTRDLLPYGQEVLRMSPCMAVAIMQSPYWAGRGVCRR